ncbi:hypothetical protein AYI70_g6320, partial [Smittium culicis]
MLTGVLGADSSGSDVIEFSKGTITASGIVPGIVLLIISIMFTFFGRIIVLYVEYKIRAPNDGENTRAIIYFIVAMLCGVLGGVLCLFLYRVGVFLIGVLGGFALANFILTFSATGVFNQNYARIIFIVVFCIIGGVLTLFMERPAIIASSSVYGSYITFVGIDCFA